MTGVYTIETLVNADTWDRAWVRVETLDEVGRPIRVLSQWLADEQPEPGTYRCTSPTREYAQLTWHGEPA